MKYLFLDANIYLHCKDYEQLNWSKILSTTKDITIVVPPITRTEIDKIKDKGTGKVNQRARNISKRFREVFLENVQSGIPMILCDAPAPKDYKKYNLDRDVQDNQFILSAILFQKNSGNDVLIVARDTNPLITAKNNGLDYLYLPDEYCLQSELSEEEKELRKVKKELEQYKNRSSKPCLSFDNEDHVIRLKKPTLQDKEWFVQRAIENEWINVPYHHDNDLSENSPMAAPLLSLVVAMNTFKPRPEEVERYNNEVEEYHKEFEEWIKIKINSDVIESRICELKFILSNEGNAPTGNLDIFINFPPHIKLYDRNSKQHFDKTAPPVKPVPPSYIPLPLNREMRKTIQNQERFSLSPLGYIDKRPKIWDLEKYIKKHEYHITRKLLSQTLCYNIDLDGIYIDLMQCGSFAIEYTIVDTSLPKPITGKLNVVVE